MNIKLIKSEIEKLSLMLSAWEQGEQVSAIERDIVLDKLKKIYDAVRFDTAIEEDAPIEPAEPVAPAVAVEENDEESDEKEVEVELIFADDEFPEEDLVDEDEIEEQPFATDIIAATVANALAGATVAESVPEEPSAPEVIEVEPAQEEDTTIIESAKEEAIIVEPAPIEVEIPHEEIPAATPEPEPVAIPVEKPTEEPTEKPIEKPIEAKPAKEPAREMNSLFNMDEVRRQPRSKHQRMMSIYNNSEPKQEKVVDISKIFNIDIDEPAEVAPVEVKPAEKPVAEPVAKPKPIEVPAAKPIVEEKPQTLADAIPATQTLADVIAAPTALADNTRVRSLRDGIGLNDKFLMIRDLFDGDGDAYEEAINALDAMETLDDCMIHIIENYAWNPDSEGSKFIMQLLERKLS